MEYLAANGAEGFEEPIKVFLSCYEILSAAQDPRAGVLLQQGYSLLQETAANLEPGPRRNAYLERVSENRALVAAWEAAGLA